jgi:hypothetical protein
VPSGPEHVPADVCRKGDPEETYQGSSGYRRIPGNTCDASRGVKKDEPVPRKCSQAAPAEGDIIHQTVDLRLFFHNSPD